MFTAGLFSVAMHGPGSLGSLNPHQFFLHHMIHMGHRNTPVKVSLEYDFILFAPFLLNCVYKTQDPKIDQNALCSKIKPDLFYSPRWWKRGDKKVKEEKKQIK